MIGEKLAQVLVINDESTSAMMCLLALVGTWSWQVPAISLGSLRNFRN